MVKGIFKFTLGTVSLTVRSPAIHGDCLLVSLPIFYIVPPPPNPPHYVIFDDIGRLLYRSLILGCMGGYTFL
jgi:hypothetical protein